MAARSTQITLHNHTDQDLTLTSDDLPGGEWTTQPPDNLGPQADTTWASESSGVATGTEGNVVYSIGGNGTSLKIAWDNPFAGTNKYATDVGSGFALYQSGWSGDNVSIDYVLESSTQHNTTFRPSQHGFPFDNSWTSAPLTSIDLGVATIPIGNAEYGLCGGMVYAALDYWAASLPVPQDRPDPAAPGTALYDFIVSRLFDSFDLPSLPATLVAIGNPAYPDTGSAGNPLEGRSPTIIKDAWPQIRTWIDGGFPAPICLVKVLSVNPLDLQHDHQVAVWGYQMSGNQVTLSLYDPNFAGRDDLTIQFDESDVLNPPSITVSDPAQGQVFCFVTTAYTQKTPPS
ncbi:hypothetical protein [Streptomyces sp. NPDC004232]|uniref:hypothetical protein n=1 Tax=unclassified Streptomyces TaxID=2593676 RepID=UPI001E0DF4D5|nr:aegerolysin family protein [Streptomyces sp. tea 10]